MEHQELLWENILTILNKAQKIMVDEGKSVNDQTFLSDHLNIIKRLYIYITIRETRSSQVQVTHVTVRTMYISKVQLLYSPTSDLGTGA